MSLDAMKTLFHPFETEALTPPWEGQTALFLGAEPGFRLPDGFAASILAVQGFRPSFLALQREGRAVKPAPTGVNYDTALVLCGRHRGQNESWIAEALERTRVGGLILISGGKDDGIASARKRLAALVAIDGSASKYHGVAFWFPRPRHVGAIVDALRAGSQSDPVEGRFQTAPGMFSHDRIDPGSKLLTDSLPEKLKGKVADFCAGWGYLSAEIADRYPGIKGLDLYEADFASLEAARRNLAEMKVPARFFWHDLTGEPVTERYDTIVMNPPFHTERRAGPGLGQAIIKAASGALKRGGTLYMVANRHLAYEQAVAEHFHRHAEIAGDTMFKVIEALR